MDFDEIAEQQGWNERTCLWLLREFVSRAGLSDELDRFALAKAEEENEAAKAGLND